MGSFFIRKLMPNLQRSLSFSNPQPDLHLFMQQSRLYFWTGTGACTYIAFSDGILGLVPLNAICFANRLGQGGCAGGSPDKKIPNMRRNTRCSKV